MTSAICIVMKVNYSAFHKSRIHATARSRRRVRQFGRNSRNSRATSAPTGAHNRMPNTQRARHPSGLSKFISINGASRSSRSIATVCRLQRELGKRFREKFPGSTIASFWTNGRQSFLIRDEDLRRSFQRFFLRPLHDHLAFGPVDYASLTRSQTE